MEIRKTSIWKLLRKIKIIAIFSSWITSLELMFVDMNILSKQSTFLLDFMYIDNNVHKKKTNMYNGLKLMLKTQPLP